MLSVLVACVDTQTVLLVTVLSSESTILLANFLGLVAEFEKVMVSSPDCPRVDREAGGGIWVFLGVFVVERRAAMLRKHRFPLGSAL